MFGALYRIRLSETELQTRLEACTWEIPGIPRQSDYRWVNKSALLWLVTTVHQPTLIVLDEPTAGLDPRASHEIRKLIRKMAGNNQTVLFYSHDMEEVESLADRSIFIKKTLPEYNQFRQGLLIILFFLILSI